MQTLLEIDWKTMFMPTVNLGEIILRGTIVYIFLFFLMRVMRRESGSIGITDLLVVVLIADAIQNAMSAEYKSLTEGAVLVATIAFWDYLLDWLGYRFPKLQRILHPPPLTLIKDGRMITKNMRKEMITEEELMSQLREEGVENISDVKKCFLEGNGHISVIKNDDKSDTRNKQKRSW